MNETRGNSRTKQTRGGLKGGEINSLKDSEKTNKNIFNIFNLISTYLSEEDMLKLQTLGFILRDYDYEHNTPKDLKKYINYLVIELVKIYEKL